MEFGRIIRILVVIILKISILVSISYAFDENTHFSINRFIAEGTDQSLFSLDKYLRNSLGFQKGVNTRISHSIYASGDLPLDCMPKTETDQQYHQDTAWRWLALGGIREDAKLRMRNHFHDPLKPWSASGWMNFDSSVIWAQHKDGIAGNAYAWQNVRDNYYHALTSTTEYDRIECFSNVFRGLGQLLHLIQDAAIPAHVRNDTHLSGDSFEKYVLNCQCTDINKRNVLFDLWLARKSEYTYNKSVLNVTSNTLAPIPIARIVDTDTYTGFNPDVTTNAPIGLSEYVNANFYSAGTLPNNPNVNYIFPDYTHATIEPFDITDPQDENVTIKRSYYVKTQDGDMGYRLAPLPMITDQYGIVVEAPALDDVVYKDYAQKLLPRAVSYSAGLLEYFFRGTIDVALPTTGAYALRTTTPQDPTKEGFNHIKLQATNISPSGDEMTNGSIELVIKYRLSQGDPFQGPPSGNTPSTTGEFFYILAPEATGKRSIPRNQTVELDFNLPLNNHLPLWATDVYIFVVYKGQLGISGKFIEDDAVAVGFKDVSEPTPLDLVNNMDKICMNGVLKTAGSTEVITTVDANHNGIADPGEWDVYPDKLSSIYIRCSPIDNPQYPDGNANEFNPVIPLISPGYYARVFVISDYQFNFAHSDTWSGPTHPDDHHSHPYYDPHIFSTSAIKNQYEWASPETCAANGGTYPCVIRWAPSFFVSRGLQSYSRDDFIAGDYPNGGSSTTCTYDSALPNIVPQPSGKGSALIQRDLKTYQIKNQDIRNGCSYFEETQAYNVVEKISPAGSAPRLNIPHHGKTHNKVQERR